MHLPLRLAITSSVRTLVALVLALGATTQAATNVRADTPVTLTLTSDPGDPWTDSFGASGQSALTFGNVGCQNVDASGLCTSGQWPRLGAAHWIWKSKNVTSSEALNGVPPVSFRKVFNVPANAVQLAGTIQITVDNAYELYLNGAKVGSEGNWPSIERYTITPFLVRGQNTLEVRASNFSFTSTDPASNPAGVIYTAAITYIRDETVPTISGTRSPGPNASGWNNTDVVVSFTCGDTLSGIKSCSAAGTTPVAASRTLIDDGANQSVTGTAVDNAGNTATATVGPINIDKTAPTLAGAPSSAPNPAGWYAGDVLVHWSCSDAVSGIAGVCPLDTAITGEGTELAARASVSDQAGNTTTATTPTFKVDRTAPNTTATAPEGWNNNSVTVRLNATDNLSGVKSTVFALDGGARQTGSLVSIGVDGIHTLQFWSEDYAGNVESAKTAQVKIDRTPPTISHSQSPAANANGWNNTDVVVTFVCNDSTSGIASCTAPQSVTSEAKGQIVTGTAVDNAGNSAIDPAAVSIDRTAPSITASRTPAPNAAGWNNGDVGVSFACLDALSGTTSCTGDTILTTEGASQSVTGTAIDAAGNKVSLTVGPVSIDRAPPSLSGATRTAPNSAGWYNGDVVVGWSCTDSLSGVAGACPVDTVVTGEGTMLAAHASVSDNAGNTTSSVVGGINIDRTRPLNAVTGVTGGARYILGAVPSAACATTDDLSGVASVASVAVSGGKPNGVGTFTVTCSGGADKAGNLAEPASITYEVIYDWDGFLQPIDDTHHQVGVTRSIFKGGSTVPAKFQLKDAAGNVVQANGVPQWLEPTSVGPLSGVIDETVGTDPLSSGSAFAWDATAQQYVYNWGTDKAQANANWRIGVTLDDGQTYYQTIGLR